MRCARHFLNFSWLTQKADSLTKFIAERQDTENMRTFRLASRTKRRTLELYYQHVIGLFQHVRRAAGIGCPTEESRPPRLHDLRHTAAVHRVVAWYRSGRDVQRLLPLLATYL